MPTHPDWSVFKPRMSTIPTWPVGYPDSISSRRILGLDPGLRVSGYAVIEVRKSEPHLTEAGVIRTLESGKPKDLGTRLKCLHDSLTELLVQFQPQHMAVEQLFAHYKHPRTAILMGHARGVLLLAAAQHEIPVVSYLPTRVKKTITGHGRASKIQMQLAMRRELRLARLPEPADVADAIAIALCHYYRIRLPD